MVLTHALRFLSFVTLGAQQAAPISIHVTETAGIRRTTYPVAARIEIPEHALPVADATHVRLRLNGADVPAQFSVPARLSHWPDGSVRQLDVDFNSSIGPRETLDYAVEYGANVAAPAAPRGLAVTETADTVQVGNVTFGKAANPLLQSVKYREEVIASRGPNGFAIVDAAGTSHDLSAAVMDMNLVTVPGNGPSFIVEKAGPLDVVLRYIGQVATDGTNGAPFELTVEMPNSKTWAKISLTVQDPRQQVRAIAFHTPLSLGAFPWLWDFGTANGTYGVFRAATDSATIAQATKPTGRTDWRVDVASGGRPAQMAESETDAPADARWGHIQGTRDSVAFAIAHPENGSSTLSVDGAGLLAVQFTPAQPAREHTLTVYEHFVASPVQVGAVTTAAAMLAPLLVH